MKVKWIYTNELDNKINIEIDPDFVVLCDLDGTLVDTNHANFLSYSKAVKKVRGNNIDLLRKYNKYKHKYKRFNREVLQKLIPDLSDKEYNQIVSLKTRYYKYYLRKTKINNFLAKYIKKYRKLNSIILLTNSRKERVIETLRYHRLHRLFNMIICRKKRSKPSNKYLSAIKILNVDKGKVLIFEDDDNEIDNAIAAGIPRHNIIKVIINNKVRVKNGSKQTKN